MIFICDKNGQRQEFQLHNYCIIVITLKYLKHLLSMES